MRTVDTLEGRIKVLEKLLAAVIVFIPIKHHRALKDDTDIQDFGKWAKEYLRDKEDKVYNKLY